MYVYLRIPKTALRSVKKKKNVRQSNTIDFWMHLVKRKKAKERKQRRASVKKKKRESAARRQWCFFSLVFVTAHPVVERKTEKRKS